LSSTLSRLRIVLVEPLRPANIGASARAMKCMGLRRLDLVRPRVFPHPDAYALAVSAADLLDTAHVHTSLHDALLGCHAAFAVSARPRHLPLTVSAPREAAISAIAQAQQGDVAIVFGSEEAGLSNADLLLCTQLVQIPSDPECRSLNLAAAVQVLSYELRLASGEVATRGVRRDPPATEFQHLIDALDQSLAEKGFYANKNRSLVFERLRRLLQRAQPNRAEIQLLRGALKRLTEGG